MTPCTTAAIVFPDGREAEFVAAGTYQYKVKVPQPGPNL